jgi:anti-sigma factor RsiW
MTAEGCREWRESLGALVLGQLDERERIAVEAHLEGCPECRAERDLLMPVAEILPLADPAWLGPSPSPPAGLGRRIARKVRAEQRSRTRRRFVFGAGFGVAAATAATVLLLVLTGGGGSSAPSGTRVEFANLPRGIKIGAHVEPEAWGSRVSVYVHGVRVGTRCVVFLRGRDGQRVPAGSFRYSWKDEAGSDLSASLPLEDAQALGIRAGHRTFVAPIPPDSA